MKPNNQEGNKKNPNKKIKTFSVPFSYEQFEKINSLPKINDKEISKEEIMATAINYHKEGNINKASKYYKCFADKGFSDSLMFSNYGSILKDLGKLNEAETYIRKSIDLKPGLYFNNYNLGCILKDLGRIKEAQKYIQKSIDLKNNFPEAYLNMGNILRDLGKLNEAADSFEKAIELKPYYAKAFFALSTMYNYSNKSKNKDFERILFSEKILENKNSSDKINIYFARSNILHRFKRYNESEKNLQLANQLNLLSSPSNVKQILDKSISILNISKLINTNINKTKTNHQSIFIVGMPRSGSTLTESIISMNSDVDPLGEINILENLFIEWQSYKYKDKTLLDLYLNKLKRMKKEKDISTNKWLNNYQYAGIIAGQVPNSKIIHCFRNPLDNILSIYRANLSQKGKTYTSSIIDCARIYLDQEKIMDEYKKKFRQNIIDLDYDLLVTQPKEQISKLISDLGWKWNDSYLSSHLNHNPFSTASSTQIRSKINSKSLGGWKNYREILQPAIEIIRSSYKYKDLEFE